MCDVRVPSLPSLLTLKGDNVSGYLLIAPIFLPYVNGLTIFVRLKFILISFYLLEISWRISFS